MSVQPKGAGSKHLQPDLGGLPDWFLLSRAIVSSQYAAGEIIALRVRAKSTCALSRPDLASWLASAITNRISSSRSWSVVGMMIRRSAFR
jgi:hypothetical protein